MKKGCIIIESRDIGNILEIVQEHMKFVPTDWGLTMYFGDENIERCKNVDFGRNVEIVSLNQMTLQQYNSMLTSLDFWKNLPYDKVLIFQTDSCLLREGIESFLQWDYIGAEWKFAPFRGNGGLSLRSKDVMVAILENNIYNSNMHGNEDVFFCNIMVVGGMNIAPVEECRKFSVETVFNLGSVGYHAIEKWLTEEECLKIKNQYL